MGEAGWRELWYPGVGPGVRSGNHYREGPAFWRDPARGTDLRANIVHDLGMAGDTHRRRRESNRNERLLRVGYGLQAPAELHGSCVMAVRRPADRSGRKGLRTNHHRL